MTSPTPTIQAMLDEAERATKGPWFRDGRWVKESAERNDGTNYVVAGVNVAGDPFMDPNNGDFIAHARENVPALCKALIAAVPYIERRRDNSIGSDKTEADNLLATITKHLEARDGK